MLTQAWHARNGIQFDPSCMQTAIAFIVLNLGQAICQLLSKCRPFLELSAAFVSILHIIFETNTEESG